MPIVYDYNLYSSSLVNKWDGQSLVADKKSSFIAANRIAVGSKDSDNRFSGVMLGDYKEYADSSVELTGIYGFDRGQQTYAFKEDGTAFIGKAGSGRIWFDGNNGIIASNNWFNDRGEFIDNANEGTLLDLDNSVLYIGDDTAYLKYNNQESNGGLWVTNANIKTCNIVQDLYFWAKPEKTQDSIGKISLVQSSDNKLTLEMMVGEEYDGGTSGDLAGGVLQLTERASALKYGENNGLPSWVVAMQDSKGYSHVDVVGYDQVFLGTGDNLTSIALYRDNSSITLSSSNIYLNSNNVHINDTLLSSYVRDIVIEYLTEIGYGEK